MIFSDKLSDASSDRPGRKSIIEQLRFDDTLIVWKLDRLARSLRDLLILTQKFQEPGADIKGLNSLNVSLTASGGKLMLSVFGAIAEFERDLAHERTIKELNFARAIRRSRRAKFIGTSNLLFDNLVAVRKSVK